MYPLEGISRWHIDRWPLLAWLETGVKLLAMLVAMVVVPPALSSGSWAVPIGIRLVEASVLGLLALGLTAAIYDRWLQRELVSMGFVLLNNLAHWGMFAAVLTRPGIGDGLRIYAGLMLLGDLVKLIFIRVHVFTVRDLPRGVLYGLTGFYIAGYLLLLILEIAR